MYLYLYILPINNKQLPLALGARKHFGLCEMPVSLAADWTTKAFIALLVAAVTDGIVQVPARTWSTARCTRTTVSTYATILHPATQQICLLYDG